MHQVSEFTTNESVPVPTLARPSYTMTSEDSKDLLSLIPSHVYQTSFAGR